MAMRRNLPRLPLNEDDERDLLGLDDLSPAPIGPPSSSSSDSSASSSSFSFGATSPPPALAPPAPASAPAVPPGNPIPTSPPVTVGPDGHPLDSWTSLSPHHPHAQQPKGTLRDSTEDSTAKNASAVAGAPSPASAGVAPASPPAAAANRELPLFLQPMSDESLVLANFDTDESKFQVASPDDSVDQTEDSYGSDNAAAGSSFASFGHAGATTTAQVIPATTATRAAAATAATAVQDDAGAAASAGAAEIDSTTSIPMNVSHSATNSSSIDAQHTDSNAQLNAARTLSQSPFGALSAAASNITVVGSGRRAPTTSGAPLFQGGQMMAQQAADERQHLWRAWQELDLLGEREAVMSASSGSSSSSLWSNTGDGLEDPVLVGNDMISSPARVSVLKATAAVAHGTQPPNALSEVVIGCVSPPMRATVAPDINSLPDLEERVPTPPVPSSPLNSSPYVEQLPSAVAPAVLSSSIVSPQIKLSSNSGTSSLVPSSFSPNQTASAAAAAAAAAAADMTTQENDDSFQDGDPELLSSTASTRFQDSLHAQYSKHTQQASPDAQSSGSRSPPRARRGHGSSSQKKKATFEETVSARLNQLARDYEKVKSLREKRRKAKIRRRIKKARRKKARARYRRMLRGGGLSGADLGFEDELDLDDETLLAEERERLLQELIENSDAEDDDEDEDDDDEEEEDDTFGFGDGQTYDGSGFGEFENQDVVNYSSEEEDENDRPTTEVGSQLALLEDNPQLTLEFVKQMMEEFQNHILIDEQNVVWFVQEASKIFSKYHNVVHIPLGKDDGRLIVIGDIHGQLEDMYHIFQLHGLPSPRNMYLFNGDLVDRGSKSIECLVTVLAFKILYPDALFINRGNHESDAMTKKDGLYAECLRKYSSTTYDAICNMFCHIPVASVVANRVFVVHGGLSADDGVTLDDINLENRMYPNPESNSLIEFLLWSDPCHEQGRYDSERGAGCLYGPDAVQDFLTTNKLDFIIRSHEAVQEGYEKFHDGKLYTLFSASNYCGVVGNQGAVCVLHHDCEPKFLQFMAPSSVSDVQGLRALHLRDQVLSKLWRLIAEKRVALIDHFRKMEMDTSNSAAGTSSSSSSVTRRGVISRRQWSAGLRAVLGKRIAFRRFERWLGLPECGVDGQPGGPINYFDFLNSYRPVHSHMVPRSQQRGAKQSPDRSAARSDDDDENDSEEVRLINEINALLFIHRWDLESLFAAFDLSGSGYITTQEFRAGFESLALTLNKQYTPEQIDKVINFIKGSIAGTSSKRHSSGGSHSSASASDTEGPTDAKKKKRKRVKINYRLFFRAFRTSDPRITSTLKDSKRLRRKAALLRRKAEKKQVKTGNKPSQMRRPVSMESTSSISSADDGLSSSRGSSTSISQSSQSSGGGGGGGGGGGDGDDGHADSRSVEPVSAFNVLMSSASKNSMAQTIDNTRSHDTTSNPSASEDAGYAVPAPVVMSAARQKTSGRFASPKKARRASNDGASPKTVSSMQFVHGSPRQRAAFSPLLSPVLLSGFSLSSSLGSHAQRESAESFDSRSSISSAGSTSPQRAKKRRRKQPPSMTPPDVLGSEAPRPSRRSAAPAAAAAANGPEAGPSSSSEVSESPSFAQPFDHPSASAMTSHVIPAPALESLTDTELMIEHQREAQLRRRSLLATVSAVAKFSVAGKSNRRGRRRCRSDDRRGSKKRKRRRSSGDSSTNTGSRHGSDSSHITSSPRSPAPVSPTATGQQSFASSAAAAAAGLVSSSADSISAPHQPVSVVDSKTAMPISQSVSFGGSNMPSSAPGIAGAATSSVQAAGVKSSRTNLSKPQSSRAKDNAQKARRRARKRRLRRGWDDHVVVLRRRLRRRKDGRAFLHSSSRK